MASPRFFRPGATPCHAYRVVLINELLFAFSASVKFRTFEAICADYEFCLQVSGSGDFASFNAKDSVSSTSYYKAKKQAHVFTHAHTETRRDELFFLKSILPFH